MASKTKSFNRSAIMYTLFDKKGGGTTYADVKQAWEEQSLPLELLPSDDLFRWALGKWKSKNKPKDDIKPRGKKKAKLKAKKAKKVKDETHDETHDEKRRMSPIHVQKYRRVERLLDEAIMVMEPMNAQIADDIRNTRRQVIMGALSNE